MPGCNCSPSSILLVLFGWLFVWLMSMIPTVMVKGFMRQLLPKTTATLLGVPLDQMATFRGRLTMLYFHVITLLVTIGWAIGRGSDVVSGEISRGTMDLLVSLPVRRAEVVPVVGGGDRGRGRGPGHVSLAGVVDRPADEQPAPGM